MASVYEIITSRIIEQLEQGVIPWRKPWTHGGPTSLTTGKPYRGINAFLLNMAPFSSPLWVTFNQAKKLGGSVRKGQRGMPVVFWKFPSREEQELAAERGRIVKPVVRYYTVFNVEQCDGLDLSGTSAPNRLSEDERIAAAEALVDAMPNRPTMVGATGAWYRPSDDTLGMPAFSAFDSAEAYYSVLFHELTHATGHESRLDREGITGETIRFGSETYAQEELVAEMGAAMLCGVTGIEQATLPNSAAYIDNWLERLRDDRRLVIFAAAQAQKAADYVRGELVDAAPAPVGEPARMMRAA